MSAAAELRKQIESALAERIPAALSFRPQAAPELLSCGIAEIDSLLGGGLPVGAIAELSGAHSSGRTTLALSTLAGLTRAGENCAYVDVSDAFDPLSAAALGMDLRRLLWVRPPQESAAPAAPTQSAPAIPPATGPTRFSRGWTHPRNETRELPRAIGELFQTPQQKPLDFTPRCSEMIRRPRLEPVSFEHASPAVAAKQTHGGPTFAAPFAAKVGRLNWTRLDRALRAVDLLLSCGGFRAIVLDMADVSPEQARRVPLATWYRFRQQAAHSRTLLLPVTSVPCAHSCAAVSLRCAQQASEWRRAERSSPVLLAGMEYRVSVERNRAADARWKKPVASESGWRSVTEWAG